MLRVFVAEPGVAPGLGDYEPPVQLYTTPRIERLILFYSNNVASAREEQNFYIYDIFHSCYNFFSRVRIFMKGKYYLFIIIAIILGGVGFVVFDGLKDKKKEEPKVENKNEIILYWGEGCEHCKKVEDFLSQNKNIEEKIKILRKEVGKDIVNSLEITARAKECKIDVDRGVAVPFLYFQGECIVGDQPIIDYLTDKTR